MESENATALKFTVIHRDGYVRLMATNEDKAREQAHLSVDGIIAVFEGWPKLWLWDSFRLTCFESGE
jgi:hypothetical protein